MGKENAEKVEKATEGLVSFLSKEYGPKGAQAILADAAERAIEDDDGAIKTPADYVPKEEDYQMPPFKKLSEVTKARMVRGLASVGGRTLEELIGEAKNAHLREWTPERDITEAEVQSLKPFFVGTLSRTHQNVSGARLERLVQVQLDERRKNQKYPRVGDDLKVRWFNFGASRGYGRGDRDLIEATKKAIRAWLVEVYGPEERDEKNKLVGFGEKLYFDKKTEHLKALLISFD